MNLSRSNMNNREAQGTCFQCQWTGLQYFKSDSVTRNDIWFKCKVRSINISLKARLENCSSVRETVSSSASGSGENRCPRKANRL